MLFILTNSEDATADFLGDKLRAAKVRFVRIDTDAIISAARLSYRLSEPILHFGETEFRPSDISTIWYRRPKKLQDTKLGTSAEDDYIRQEWIEAVEGFFAHVPKHKWMNHPASNAAASHKIEQLTSAAAIGLEVPRTIVTQDPGSLKSFFKEMDGYVIVKPMATGYIERGPQGPDSLIYTNRVKVSDLADLADLSNCPTLFQEYVRKRYDIRVTVVDSRMHAVALSAEDENGTPRCDIRRNNMIDVRYETVDIPSDTAKKITNLLTHYGLRFAAIDFAASASGEWLFLEINPNGQWAWLEQSAGIPISDSFIESFST